MLCLSASLGRVRSAVVKPGRRSDGCAHGCGDCIASRRATSAMSAWGATAGFAREERFFRVSFGTTKPGPRRFLAIERCLAALLGFLRFSPLRRRLPRLIFFVAG